eukprot:TRINITY_DN3735_c0_g1_i2.p1 TRINITY_DN3735_c0_g1~~TRINITY_DN3735_c0_g1_i2.p1  ORF type:complete len:957 (+),score=156.61 TRINITY_DN3735_c0_g1_i2:139-3009(+)
MQMTRIASDASGDPVPLKRGYLVLSLHSIRGTPLPKESNESIEVMAVNEDGIRPPLLSHEEPWCISGRVPMIECLEGLRVRWQFSIITRGAEGRMMIDGPGDTAGDIKVRRPPADGTLKCEPDDNFKGNARAHCIIEHEENPALERFCCVLPPVASWHKYEEFSASCIEVRAHASDPTNPLRGLLAFMVRDGANSGGVVQQIHAKSRKVKNNALLRGLISIICEYSNTGALNAARNCGRGSNMTATSAAGCAGNDPSGENDESSDGEALDDNAGNTRKRPRNEVAESHSAKKAKRSEIRVSVWVYSKRCRAECKACHLRLPQRYGDPPAELLNAMAIWVLEIAPCPDHDESLRGNGVNEGGGSIRVVIDVGSFAQHAYVTLCNIDCDGRLKYRPHKRSTKASSDRDCVAVARTEGTSQWFQILCPPLFSSKKPRWMVANCAEVNVELVSMGEAKLIAFSCNLLRDKYRLEFERLVGERFGIDAQGIAKRSGAHSAQENGASARNEDEADARDNSYDLDGDSDDDNEDAEEDEDADADDGDDDEEDDGADDDENEEEDENADDDENEEEDENADDDDEEEEDEDADNDEDEEEDEDADNGDDGEEGGGGDDGRGGGGGVDGDEGGDRVDDQYWLDVVLSILSPDGALLENASIEVMGLPDGERSAHDDVPVIFDAQAWAVSARVPKHQRGLIIRWHFTMRRGTEGESGLVDESGDVKLLSPTLDGSGVCELESGKFDAGAGAHYVEFEEEHSDGRILCVLPPVASWYKYKEFYPACIRVRAHAADAMAPGGLLAYVVRDHARFSQGADVVQRQILFEKDATRDFHVLRSLLQLLCTNETWEAEMEASDMSGGTSTSAALQLGKRARAGEGSQERRSKKAKLPENPALAQEVEVPDALRQARAGSRACGRGADDAADEATKVIASPAMCDPMDTEDSVDGHPHWEVESVVSGTCCLPF